MTDERARRIGENEHLFRTVNEKIEGLNEAFGLVSDEFTVVCECGDALCLERFPVARADYRAVREDSTLFLLVPGHDDPDVEDVVARAERYWTVRKRPGGPAELAQALDE